MKSFNEKKESGDYPVLILARIVSTLVNLLATDFFFQILAHSVFKMWVIQKLNKVALWNKRHFEEKKYRLSVRIFVE